MPFVMDKSKSKNVVVISQNKDYQSRYHEEEVKASMTAADKDNMKSLS